MRRDEIRFGLFYGWLLRLYPRPFYEAFGQEMEDVFREAMDAALRSREKWGALVLFLRELRDWPGALLIAHMDHVRNRLVLRSLKGEDRIAADALARSGEAGMDGRDALKDVTRKQARGMALPPLILGVAIAAAALIRTDVWYRLPSWQLYLSAAVPLLAGVVVAIVALIALLRRMPSWGLTWIGTGFLGFTMTVQVVLGELVEETAFTLSPVAESVLAAAFFLTGLLLLFFAARVGWAHAGLLTLAAAATMGLALLQSVTAAPFNRDDLALLAGPAGLVFAALIYFYVVETGLSRYLTIAATGLFNVGVVLLTTNALSSWLAARDAPSPIVPLLVLITGLLLSGPISGVMLKPLRRT